GPGVGRCIGFRRGRGWGDGDEEGEEEMHAAPRSTPRASPGCRIPRRSRTRRDRAADPRAGSRPP
ncbi:MAG: hypothetical protein WB493_14890, partial [Anaeromyxobacteraceae bacterium]